MGNKFMCCKKNGFEPLNALAPNEKEIKFSTYHSKSDEQLEKLEKDNNIFTYVQLIEFLNLLENYSPETATESFNGKLKKKFDGKDAFLENKINIEEFQSFLENKILKIKEVSEIIEKDDELISIFKDSFRQIYSSLRLKLNQHYSEDDQDRIKKKHLICIGFLFCLSSNVSKMRVMFDLYKNENEKLTKSDSLNEFLITMFLISSYCLVSARTKLGNTYTKIGTINIEELKKILDASELKDNKKLVEIFNEKFFNKDELTWDEFKEKFSDKKNGFGWVFSTKGIRQKLEENNV